MKKFLSLVLALVMTMSLVTVSAGAKDFTDSSKINYDEAVAVMSAVKVIDGYTDGSFNPSATLTRGAAAKIICNLILGPTTASALVADAAPYSDVPTNHTFAGYIAYCQKEGIISGYADGTFKPANSLTGYAFMKMLLGALGYDGEVEGYTGPNWSVNVAKRALNIGLADDLVGDFNGVKAVTREEACLYALNTMTANMVEYDSKTSVSAGNTTVVIAGSKAKDMTNTAKTETIKNDGKMQFAEKYFPDLTVRKGADDFERPANVWKNKSDEIGTYTDTPDLTYTKKVENGDIYKDLGLTNTIEKTGVALYEDGDQINSVVLRKGGDTKVGNSGNGVLTEVFYNDKTDTAIITQINTYVGEVSKTVKATDKKDAYVVVVPADGTSVVPAGGLRNGEFETDDTFEDDAYVLYTYSLKADEIKSVANVSKAVSGTATQVENNRNLGDENKAVTIESTSYKFSKKSAGVSLSDISVDTDYDLYLDAYGYAIFVEEIEEIGNYALLMNYQNKSDFNDTKALLVFADGTEKVVTTAKDYKKTGSDQLALGTIVTYKENNGVYTLKAVKETFGSAKVDTNSTLKKNLMGGNTYNSGANGDFVLTSDKAGVQLTANAGTTDVHVINKTGKKTAAVTPDAHYGTYVGKSYVGGIANTNSKTVFVVYNVADDEYTTYTGIKNAPSINAGVGVTAETVQYHAYVKNGMTKIMFIQIPNANCMDDSNSKKMIFLAGESVSNLISDKLGEYYVFNAIVDGKLETVKVDSAVKVYDTFGATSNTLTADFTKELNGLFQGYSVNSDGIITRLTTYAGYTAANPTKQAVNGNVAAKLSYKDAAGVTHTSATIQTSPVNAVGIDRHNEDYTVILDTAGTKKTITCDDEVKVYYVDDKGNITESSYKGVVRDDDDYAYAVVQDNLVKYLVVEKVDTKNNAQAATVTVNADKTTCTVGEKVTLTASVTLNDVKNDKITGYQWYTVSGGVWTAIAGATGKTYEYTTTAADIATGVSFGCEVTTVNYKVDGKDTAVAQSNVKAVTVNAVVVPDMNILVNYKLADGTVIDTKTTTKKDSDKNPAGYVDVDSAAIGVPATYKVVGATKQTVKFVAGSDVTVNFIVETTDVEPMSILIDYKLADGTLIDQATQSVSAEPAGGYETVTATAPAGYKVVGAANQKVKFVAGSDVTVTFTIVAKSNDTTLKSATAVATIAAGAITKAEVVVDNDAKTLAVTLTMGGKSSAEDDSVEVSVVTNCGDASADNVTVTKGATAWVTGQKLTVTAENGTTADYTITVTEA